MISYGFIENQDFTTITQKRVTAQGNETTYIDHAITLDMAKHIAMIQRTELGMKLRNYFIECEKQLNQQVVLSEKEKLALKLFNGGIDAVEAHKQLLELETKPLKEEIEVQKQVIKDYTPKVSYYDLVLQSKGTMTVTQIAKDYGMSAKQFNSKLHDMNIQYKQGSTWLLYSKYQGMGYTQSSTYVDNTGTSRLNTKWTQKGRLFIYDEMKKIGIIPVIERENDEVDIINK